MRRGKGIWDYPLLTAAMEEAGFEEIKVYRTRRKNMVAQYIVMRPILYLCEQCIQILGSYVSQRLWDQEEIILEGEK